MQKQNPSIHIREAVLDDAPQICKLANQLGYPGEIEKFIARLEKMLDNPTQNVLVAANQRQQAVGYIHFHPHNSLENDPVVEIGGLVVSEEFRRMGIGKILMVAAEDWAKSAGFSRIRLHSNIIREDAHIFYQALGYSITKTQRAFVKDLT
jgi:GNAT superfamily N-acetyltransferase